MSPSYKNSQTWITSNDNFVFEFTWTYSQIDILQQVSVYIFRKDAPGEQFFQGNVAYEGNPTVFRLNYSDGNDCQGMLYLVEMDEKETGIFGDFHYGVNLGYHFEGVMVIIPAKSVISPPVKPNPPINPFPGPPQPIFPNSQFVPAGTDLFSFTGLRQPGTVPLPDRGHFLSLANPSDFYQDLLELVAEGGSDLADQLVDAAVQYLTGSGSELDELEDFLELSHFGLIAIYRWLENNGETPLVWEAVEEKLFEVFSVPTGFTPQEWFSEFKNTTANTLLSLFMLYAQPLSTIDPETTETNLVGEGYAALIEELILLFRLIAWFRRCATGMPADRTNATLTALITLESIIFEPLVEAGMFGTISTGSNGSLTVPGVGELLVVRQQLEGYAEGEIAHIENVMQSELKIRSEREITRTETNTQEKLRNQGQDSRSTEAKDLYDVIQGLMEGPAPTSKSIDYGDTGNAFTKSFIADSGSTTETVSGGWTVTVSPEEDLEKKAFKFVRDITGHALAQLQREVSSLRGERMSKELERTRKNEFDNREGLGNLTGIYYWLNKVYQAQLLSLGQHLVLRFEIPWPAEDLDGNLETVLDSGALPLVELKSLDFTTLTYEMYLRYAVLLGLEPIAPLPTPSRTVTAVLESTPQVNSLSVAVPEGYQAQNASVSYLFDGIDLTGFVGSAGFDFGDSECGATGGPFGTVNAVPASGFTEVTGEFGEVELPEIPPMTPTTFNAGCNQLQLNQESGMVPVTVMTDASYWSMNVEIVCELDPLRVQEWQARAWAQLLKAVRDLESDPQAQKSQQERWNAQKELERKILTDRSREILQETLSESDAPFEQTGAALLWDSMAWSFTAPIGSGTNPSEQTFYSKDPDPHFPAFLVASSATVEVAVRNPFEVAALFSLWTQGIRWYGLPGDAPILDQQKFIADLLVFRNQVNVEQVLRTWQIQEPTTLMILQNSGNALLKPDNSENTQL